MAAAIGAGTTRATRGTAADPVNPLSGEPMVAPEPDPDPDPGSGKGAAGPGGAVTRHTKGPQETVRIPELNTVWKTTTLQHCKTYCSHFFYSMRADLIFEITIQQYFFKRISNNPVPLDSDFSPYT